MKKNCGNCILLEYMVDNPEKLSSRRNFLSIRKTGYRFHRPGIHHVFQWLRLAQSPRQSLTDKKKPLSETQSGWNSLAKQFDRLLHLFFIPDAPSSSPVLSRLKNR